MVYPLACKYRVMARCIESKSADSQDNGSGDAHLGAFRPRDTRVEFILGGKTGIKGLAFIALEDEVLLPFAVLDAEPLCSSSKQPFPHLVEHRYQI